MVNDTIHSSIGMPPFEATHDCLHPRQAFVIPSDPSTMRSLFGILAIAGIVMSEDFQCYTCENESGLMVDCGTSMGTLKQCPNEFHFCLTVQAKNAGKEETIKGCGKKELNDSAFEELNPKVKQAIKKAIETPALPKIWIDGCLDITEGESKQVQSTVCFCSTSKCNAEGSNGNSATGSEIMNSLVAFGALILRRFA
ncbi:hypothetical protein TCAL_15451 [Tigriopus californicus]|uniref:Uncharacterized protein n=2 Tax=Tigriopus californicus TaxID=6832 RepID=A0A553PRN8_TIGCA|nr:hypothetical protein TCAL_15451 [Tigriopus californicus]